MVVWVNLVTKIKKRENLILSNGLIPVGSSVSSSSGTESTE